MDDIGSKPLPIVEATEGFSGASCMGDIPPVLEGRPGPPGPPGPMGPGNLWPGLGTGKRLDETMGDLGPDPPGLGAGNFESG